LILEGTKIRLFLATINGTQERNGVKVDLNVRGVGQDKTIFMSNVVAVSQLPDICDNIPSREDLEHYSTLLRDAQINWLSKKTVDRLIGEDLQAAHRLIEYRAGGVDGPNAVHTALGWTLIGPEGNLVSRNRTRINFIRLSSVQLH